MSALPEHVAVGWSGGADSTALLLALKSAGHHVRAWHVDHGWRRNSAAEAQALAKKAEAWDIPFFTARLSHAGAANREAVARKGRYDQFVLWAGEQGVSTLCLGHHRDDQAETVCMRMLQGAGSGGCVGMRRERRMGTLRIVRPLLHVPGGKLRAALQKDGVGWLEDPSNSDMSIWRNRIRHRLFPAMSRAGQSPQELFLRWQKQAERLTGLLDLAADALLRAGNMQLSEGSANGARKVILLWSEWKASAPPVRARALQKMMAQLFGEGVTPGRRHILLVEQWMIHGARGGLDLTGCRLRHCRERLHLESVRAGCAV